MGFLDFFRKKSKDVKPQKTLQVHVLELPEWIKKTFNDQIKDILNTARKMQKSIVKGFSDVKRSCESLEKSDLSGTDRIHSAARMVKEQFVKKTIKLSESFQGLQSIDNYKNLKEFHDQVVSALDAMTDVTQKQAFLLSNYFRDEINQVTEKIKSVREIADSLGNFIEFDTGPLYLLDVVREKIKTYQRLKNELKLLEKEKSDLETKLFEIKESLQHQKASLQKLLESDEYVEFEKTEREIEKLNKTLSEIREKLLQEVTSIEKPFRKLEYLANKDYILTKDQEWFLTEFLEKPFETIMLDGSEEFLEDILTTIDTLLKENKLALKTQEYKRLKELLNKLESKIPQLKELYKRTEAELKSLQDGMKEYSHISKEKKHLEDSLKKGEKDIKSIEEDLENVKKKTESIRNEIKGILKGLESEITEVTGMKIIIEE